MKTIEETMKRSMSRRGFIGTSLAATCAAGLGNIATVDSLAAAETNSKVKTRPPVSFTRVVDLTHLLFEGFPTYDGAKWFTKEPVFSYAQDKMNINRWSVVEHTGTHMDAPLHFSADGLSIDEIPISDLVVPLVVIDISERAQTDPDATVTPDDIHLWEKQYGDLPMGCCVVMNSGWHRLSKSPRFTGKDSEGKYHTPGFALETAQMLIHERFVKGIGVDTLSLDTGISTGTFPVHNLWLPSGRWGIEALAHLDEVPAYGAHLVVGGPKVEGATGGPSRIMALV
ncbi:cyclase family protein [Pseudomonas sp. LTJR-52]|uniref:cyclase family protein n=1 Tax=Pseudomonas sp. LTJR-52 TaxID=2479392 RepID=UPI001C49AE0D|nr:cyclase family protein [Pseudomonas sp. LTJR-52]